MHCTICKEEFTFKKSNKGKINECDDCTEEMIDDRYLGYNDGSLNKSTHISIYKGNDPNTKKKIQFQSNRVR